MNITKKLFMKKLPILVKYDLQLKTSEPGRTKRLVSILVTI